MLKWERMLALAAAGLMGAPSLAASSAGSVLWIPLCDSAHPGESIPLPLGKGRDDQPAQGCHAGCAMLSDRRARR